MYRRILNLSMPLMLSNISLPLCGFINSVLMAHLSDSKYLAASALGNSLLILIVRLFNFLRMSTTGTVAQYFAKDEWEHIQLWLSKALLATLSASLLILVAQPIIIHLFLFLSGSAPKINILVTQYFKIAIFTVFFSISNYIFIGFFIGIQQTSLILKISIIKTLSSIMLSIILIYRVHMNIKGLALSTLLSEATSFCISLYYIYHTMKSKSALTQISITKKRLLDITSYRVFFSININLLIRSLCILIALQSFTFLSSRLGENILAVNQLLFQFSFLIAISLDAFSNTTEALIGQHYANQQIKKIILTAQRTFLYFLIITILFTLAYALMHNWIISQLTTIPSLRVLAKRYAGYAILLPLSTMNAFWLDGIFNGLLKTKTMRNAMMLSLVGYFFCLAILSRMGNTGLWLSIQIFFILRGITLFIPLLKFIKLEPQTEQQPTS